MSIRRRPQARSSAGLFVGRVVEAGWDRWLLVVITRDGRLGRRWAWKGRRLQERRVIE